MVWYDDGEMRPELCHGGRGHLGQDLGKVSGVILSLLLCKKFINCTFRTLYLANIVGRKHGARTWANKLGQQPGPKARANNLGKQLDHEPGALANNIGQ